MYSETSVLAIYRRGVGRGERGVHRALRYVAIPSYQGVIVYVFLQDHRRREEDADGEAPQLYQRLKATGIERLTNVAVSVIRPWEWSATDR